MGSVAARPENEPSGTVAYFRNLQENLDKIRRFAHKIITPVLTIGGCAWERVW